MIDLDSPPDHCVYDPGRVRLHRRALQLMQPNSGIDYLEAVRMAAGEYRAPAGFTADPDRLQLHLAALRMMAPARGVGYLEAVLLAEKVIPFKPAPQRSPPATTHAAVTLAPDKTPRSMYVRLVGGLANLT